MRDDWTETTLGDVAEWYSGGTPKAGDPRFYMDGNIPWATIADMLQTYVSTTKTFITDAGLAEIGGRLAPAGSVLVSMYATVGRAAQANVPLATNQAIAWSVPDLAKVLPRFLLFQVQAIEKLIADQARGATQRNINREILRGISFSLPPLEEQRRIVDVVASVDTYIDTLKDKVAKARTARNAVLHELLSAGGSDWTETTLGEVALVNPTEPALPADAPFAPMDAVHVGRRNVQYFEERGLRSGARARAGDVLFARITPCLENGKVAQVPQEIARCGGSTEFLVIRGTDKVGSDFLYFWATNGQTRFSAESLMTGTTGRQRLSSGDLAALKLFLPPLEEQRRIVDIVSSMDDVIVASEKAVAEAVRLRAGLLSDLLSGEHEIPVSYDAFLEAA